MQIRGVKITAVPAIHITFSTGFVVEAEGKTVYFAGDTYYRPFFGEIAKHFNVDAALIPIIGYRIPMTMDERRAVHAVLDLQPRVVIPIHLSLSPRLPWLRTNDSVAGFTHRLADRQSPAVVHHLQPGESLTI